MIKLLLRKIWWSEEKSRQQAYERGRSDQAEEDAEAIEDWLIRTGQMEPWLGINVEVLKEE